MKKTGFCLILRRGALLVSLIATSTQSFAGNTAQGDRKPSQEPKSWEVSWMMGLTSENETSDSVQDNNAGLLAELKAKQTWNSVLGFTGDVRAHLKSGQRDSQDGNKPAESVIKLYEASLNVGYKDGAEADLGVLDPQTNHSVLMFDHRGFPGARPEFTYASPGQEFTIFTEVLAPQSLQVNSATGEKQGFPTFIAGGVKQKFRWSSRFESFWHVGSFQFQGLNTSVQNTSTFLGNTPAPGPTADLALLRYKYSGFEIGQSHRWLIAPKFLTELSGDYVMNSNAEAGLNSAYRGGISLTSVLMPKYHLITELEGFHIEPDAVLGAYSNTDYFNSNRNGYRVGLGLYLKQEKLKISASYVEAQPIFISPPQTHEQLIYLKLETLYDKI